MEWVDLLREFGITVLSLLACGWCLYKIVMRDKDEASKREEVSKETQDKLIEANMKNSAALEKVADTIKETNDLNKELSEKNRILTSIIDEKLDRIELNVEHIKESINR